MQTGQKHYILYKSLHNRYNYGSTSLLLIRNNHLIFYDFYLCLIDMKSENSEGNWYSSWVACVYQYFMSWASGGLFFSVATFVKGCLDSGLISQCLEVEMVQSAEWENEFAPYMFVDFFKELIVRLSYSNNKNHTYVGAVFLIGIKNCGSSHQDRQKENEAETTASATPPLLGHWSRHLFGYLGILLSPIICKIPLKY